MISYFLSALCWSHTSGQIFTCTLHSRYKIAYLYAYYEISNYFKIDSKYPVFWPKGFQEKFISIKNKQNIFHEIFTGYDLQVFHISFVRRILSTNKMDVNLNIATEKRNQSYRAWVITNADHLILICDAKCRSFRRTSDRNE